MDLPCWLPKWHTSWSGFPPLIDLTSWDTSNPRHKIVRMFKSFPRRYAQKRTRNLRPASRRIISHTAVARNPFDPTMWRIRSIRHPHHTIPSQKIHRTAQALAFDKCIASSLVVHPPYHPSAWETFSKTPANSNHYIKLKLANNMLAQLINPRISKRWRKLAAIYHGLTRCHVYYNSTQAAMPRFPRSVCKDQCRPLFTIRTKKLGLARSKRSLSEVQNSSSLPVPKLKQFHTHRLKMSPRKEATRIFQLAIGAKSYDSDF